MKRTLLALVAFALLVAVSLRVADRGRFAVPLSTFGAGPDGAKGIFELTRQLGFRAERLSEDFGRLSPSQVLVALGRCDLRAQRKLTRADRDALVAFVERGGSLWLIGPSEVADERLGVRFGSVGGCERLSLEELLAQRPDLRDATTEVKSVVPPNAVEVPFRPETTDPRLVGVGIVTFVDPAPIELEDRSAPFEDLVRHGEAAWVRRVRVGRGEVIAVASSSMLRNAGLVSDNGAAFFEALLRTYAAGRTVVFDEFHLGVGDRRSAIGYLLARGWGPGLFGVLVAIGALLWRMTVRLAPARDAAPARVGGLIELVRGVGTLYTRVGDAALAFEVLRRNALTRIARKHHIETTFDAASLLRRLDAVGRERARVAVRSIFALTPVTDLGAPKALLDRERELDALVLEAEKDEGES